MNINLKGRIQKEELFGNFRRGGFSGKVNFRDHFFEEINIRLDNKQNKLLVLLIIIYKFFKHFKNLMKILITGVAGFIGMNAALNLLKKKHEIYGLDNFDDLIQLN